MTAFPEVSRSAGLTSSQMARMQQNPSEEVQQRLGAEFARAVSVLGLTADGNATVWGWQGRSLSGPVHTGNAWPGWLKVRARSAYDDEPRQWSQVAHAELAVPEMELGIARPRLHRIERFTSLGWRYQAELYSRAPVPAMTISRAAPAAAADLPPAWWHRLRESLDALPQLSARGLLPMRWYTRAARSMGEGVDTDQWVPAHGDICWANLAHHQGNPWIFDWDTFDLAPRYIDAATLLVCSLDTPDIAARVQETFADQLDSPDGHYAQRILGEHWLTRITGGEHVDLGPALRDHLSHLSTTAPDRRVPRTGGPRHGQGDELP